MGRKLKPYKLETVHHAKHGLKVDIYLDRNDQKFYGILHGETYRADSAVEVKRLVWDAMNAWRVLEWEQVILVNWDDRAYEATWNDSLDFGCAMEFSFGRIEVSKSASGREITRPFLSRGAAFGEEEPNSWEVEHRKTDDDWDTKYGLGHYSCLPYDETVWQTLVELKKRTDALTARLADVLGKHPERLKTIGVAVLKQLAAGDDSESR